MTLGNSSIKGRNKEIYLNVKTFDTACSLRSWGILEDITAMFQFSSVAQLCLALCDPMDCITPSFPVHHQLLELAQPHVHPDHLWIVMPPNHLILCHPLLLLPSIFPSIRLFSNESALHIRWPKYWSFSFNISPSNEYSGLISFRIDWFDFLVVQGTLKSLLQHHSSKAAVFSTVLFSPIFSGVAIWVL